MLTGVWRTLRITRQMSESSPSSRMFNVPLLASFYKHHAHTYANVVLVRSPVRRCSKASVLDAGRVNAALTAVAQHNLSNCEVLHGNYGKFHNTVQTS
jgi:hypothetical protein